RGRAFCIYGKPDDIERHSLEGTTRPYEIWYYNRIQSGVIFVFIDFSTNNGDFRLVHSTAVGELFDNNWRARLEIKTVK
ncbi:MAG TPA: GWxTD domain-containing protein, partial [Ignavibacteria bacterium]